MATTKAMADPNERMRLELNSALLTATRYIKAMRKYIQDDEDGLRKMRAEKLVEGLESVSKKYWKPEDLLR